MKKAMLIVVCGFMMFATAFSAQAATQKVTPQQVVKTVKAAVALIQAKGPKTAFPLLSDPQGAFVKGNLYVFVLNMQGITLEHLNSKLVGVDMMNFKDPKGKCIGCDFVRIAREKGSGWSQYYWPEPSTHKLSIKTSYIMRVPGKDMLVGAGVYGFTKAEAEKAMGSGQ